MINSQKTCGGVSCLFASLYPLYLHYLEGKKKNKKKEEKRKQKKREKKGKKRANRLIGIIRNPVKHKPATVLVYA